MLNRRRRLFKELLRMCENENNVSEHGHMHHGIHTPHAGENDHSHHGVRHVHDHHSHKHGDGMPQFGDALVIRPSSGLGGDMMVTGLARMAGIEQVELQALVASIGLPELEGCVVLEQRQIQSVNGWTASVTLPSEHAHRTLADILGIVGRSGMEADAKHLAEKVFSLLAEAEGKVHGIAADAVTFHEVGALDSILDICLACILFDRLDPTLLVCGPLPLCDGTVHCSHGAVQTPAPAVLELLGDIPIVGIPSCGETVTPTAVALLKGLGAQFGPWPGMIVRRAALVYGTRVLPGVPNGAIFSWGQAEMQAIKEAGHSA
jgi:hypothetical protein